MKIENRFVIGHIGRFCNAKNHKKLIEIFEQVYKQCRNARLLLVGSGELQEEIKQLVEQKKLEDVVIFYGATTKVPELLQAMDCFVLPSLYEGLPLAGIEAQTAGLPVIMSDTITREVKVSDLAHYFPLKSSAEEWAEEILKVKSEQPERRDMSEEIRKTGFDIKEISKLMIQKYISLCENK